MYHPSRIKLFPKLIRENARLIEGENVFVQLDNLSISEKSFTFLDLPDAHLIVNDYLSFSSSVKRYNSLVNNTLVNIDNKIDINSFDITVVFSDHGHSGYVEQIISPKVELLNSKRTKVLMHIKTKNDKETILNSDLHSITDFYDTLFDYLGIENFRNGDFGNVSFLSNFSRKSVIFEEMFEWYLGANQLPKVWACLIQDGYYQIDSDFHEVTKGDYASAKLELFNNYSNVVRYLDEYKHFNGLKSSFNLDKKSIYTDGSKRRKPIKYRIINWIILYTLPRYIKSVLKSGFSKINFKR